MNSLCGCAGKVLLMLGKVQLELQKLLDGYVRIPLICDIILKLLFVYLSNKHIFLC